MKIYKYELDVALHARTTKSQTPGYADLPEDERNFPLPSLALTNPSSFGDLLLLSLLFNIIFIRGYLLRYPEFHNG